MGKLFKFYSSIALVTFSISVFSADEDGCWTGQHRTGPCLEYSTYEKSGKTYFELTNVCTDRLYVKWCADSHCGSDSIRGGQTRKKYEYATGARTEVKAIGSNKSSKDWVCTGKVSGWNS